MPMPRMSGRFGKSGKARFWPNNSVDNTLIIDRHLTVEPHESHDALSRAIVLLGVSHAAPQILHRNRTVAVAPSGVASQSSTVNPDCILAFRSRVELETVGFKRLVLRYKFVPLSLQKGQSRKSFRHF